MGKKTPHKAKKTKSGKHEFLQSCVRVQILEVFYFSVSFLKHQSIRVDQGKGQLRHVESPNNVLSLDRVESKMKRMSYDVIIFWEDFFNLQVSHVEWYLCDSNWTRYSSSSCPVFLGKISWLLWVCHSLHLSPQLVSQRAQKILKCWRSRNHLKKFMFPIALVIFSLTYLLTLSSKPPKN